MKHKVKVVETLERIVEVEADDIYEAIEIVEDMVNCEDIVLDADDFTGREFYPVEE